MTIQNDLIVSLTGNGDKIAISAPGGSVSYRELLRRSDKITAFLLEKLPSTQRMIGISLSDKTDFIAAMIGVLNARCVFVPLDGSLPAARVTDMLSDLALECIIGPELVEDIFASQSDDLRINYPEYADDDSIYVYFTSGSTGRPKGIVGRNKSLQQFVEWEIGAFEIAGDTRFSQFVSPYFDAFLRDVFVPLVAGGTICVPPRDEDFFTGPKVTAWIDAEGVNVIHCVPSVFRLINHSSLTADNFKALRCILLSGEKILPEQLVSWYSVFGERIQLVNLYGPTETTMVRSFYRIRPEDTRLTRIPIGTPIAGTRLLVTKDGVKPCGVMVPGDLYIISEYVSKGYLNDPVATSEKFTLLNPGQPREVFAYKTGDTARLLADGNIDLLGREDRQIKLRGVRIEPDEIEAVLYRSGLIKNAVVIHDPEMNNDGGGLVAFVVADGAPADLVEQLRRQAESYLPVYALPAAITVLAEFPLLPNGKINYRELLAYKAPVTEAAVPLNAREEKVLVIWKEILGDKEISTEDNFFSIGGSSLGMMRLIAKIYKEMNVRISLDELFNNLTIKKQAELIRVAEAHHLYTIPVAEYRSEYNLSAAQLRMYYNYEINRDSTAYNLPMAWEIKGSVDPEKVTATLQELVSRHEILRTVFAFVDGKVMQKVKDAVDFGVTALSAGSDTIEGVIASFIRPFDLENGPLFRAAIVSFGGGRKFLLIDVHHIVCDGQSQMNLLADFVRLYNGIGLQPLPIQYKDYAEWEHGFRDSQEYIYHREFWLKNFSGEIPEMAWPIADKAQKPGMGEGSDTMFTIGRSALLPLLTLAEEQNVTLFSGIFSAWLLFLSQLTGQDDLVIGINTSGRMQDELEGGVGMYAKTLPIRYRIDPSLPFNQLLKNTHTRLVEAQSKQIYDLADIVGELSRQREVAIKELIGAMFVYQGFESQIPVREDSEFIPYLFEQKTAKYPMSLFVTEEPDDLVFRWEYATSYFTSGDMEVLVAEFKRLLQEICNNTSAAIVNLLASSGEFEDVQSKEAIDFNF